MPWKPFSIISLMILRSQTWFLSLSSMVGSFDNPAAEISERYTQPPKAFTEDTLPVSYTHLDVYKRRAKGRRRKTIQPPQARQRKRLCSISAQRLSDTQPVSYTHLKMQRIFRRTWDVKQSTVSTLPKIAARRFLTLFFPGSFLNQNGNGPSVPTPPNGLSVCGR